MECTQDFYLHNFKFVKCSEFSEDLYHDGISIYEVIRIEKGIPLFIENHLNRLFHSAEISNLNIDESYCDFETLIEQLINKNNTSFGKIKIIIHYNSDCNNSEKDLLIYFTQHYFPSELELFNGVNIGICQAIRTNPHAKILNTEARLRANNSIVESKLFEVLLQDSDGYITEGSRSNVFFIKNETVITSPENDVLMGITRTNIIKICKQNNISLIEQKVHFSDLSTMDSVFISGTSLKILPVKNIEEIQYSIQNKVLKKIMELYDSLIDDYIKERLS